MSNVAILEFSKSEAGRLQMKTNGDLHLLCVDLLSGESSDPLTTARALRNACAGNEENAVFIGGMQVLEWFAAHCREAALWKLSCKDERHDLDGGTYDQTEMQKKGTLFLALCQFLSNFAGCGEQSSMLLWSPCFGENGFRDALAAAATVRSRKCMAAIISAIHNSIRQIQLERGTALLCSSRGLASQLLLSAAPPANANNNVSTSTTTYSSHSSSISSSNDIKSCHPATSSQISASPDHSNKTTSAAEESNDPVIEWLHILYFNILTCKKNCLLNMFSTLKPRAVGENVWDFDTKIDIENKSYDQFDIFGESDEIDKMIPDQAVLTHEQIILLQIILGILEDSLFTEELIKIEYPNYLEPKIETVDKIDNINVTLIDEGLNVSAENFFFDKSITKDFLLEIINIVNTLYDKINSESYNGNSYVNSNLYSCEELLLLCLNVLGAGVSYPPRDGGSYLRTLMSQTNILDICCKILKSNDEKKVAFMAKKVREREFKLAKLTSVNMKEVESSDVDSIEYTHNNRNENNIKDCNNKVENQNHSTGKKVEKEEEEEEEWVSELVKAALQVIGNLSYGCHAVQGNKANQDFIQILQPQKVVADEYLQSLGLQVHIDPSTGKISATSTSTSTSNLVAIEIDPTVDLVESSPRSALTSSLC